jgi:hypothetical protein
LGQIGFAHFWSSTKQNKRLFWKKMNTIREINHDLDQVVVFWGHAPRPPGSASPSVGSNKPSAKQNKRFLLLFLEKEEYHSLD